MILGFLLKLILENNSNIITPTPITQQPVQNNNYPYIVQITANNLNIRKVYFTKPFPKKELIIERLKDGKEYEIVVPPEDNYFEDKNFYYKCFIAVKEISNDPD